MRGLSVVLLLIFVVGCMVTDGDGVRRKDGGEKEWRVVQTEREFLRRYPDLPIEYFSWVRKTERLYDEGERKREEYLDMQTEEERPEQVKLRNDAKTYYMRALKEAKKILDRTKARSIAQLIGRISGSLRQVQYEIERERGLIKGSQE